MLNRLEMLRIFITAAESPSFKEAANQLGVSPQVVTRAVKELEESVGELLFHRNTRSVRITAFGEAFAARARSGVEQIDTLFQSEARSAEAMDGIVRVAAPAEFGRRILMPLLGTFGRQHPMLQIELHLSDQHASVVDEKIDLGVRIGFPRDNRFVIRPLTQVPFYFVAAPALIALHGAPLRPEDLLQRPTTASLDHDSGRPWPWLFAGGVQLPMPRPAFIADDAEAERLAAVEGLGFGQFPAFSVVADLAAGRLQRVLTDCEPAPWPLYLYRPQRGPVPARIRALFDHLQHALATLPTAPAT